MRCNYCKHKATHRKTPDMDIKGIFLCDEDICFIKMSIDIDPNINI